MENSDSIALIVASLILGWQALEMARCPHLQQHHNAQHAAHFVGTSDVAGKQPSRNRHHNEWRHDGSVVMVNIPGHCDGLCAVKITNADGKFVLLFADGGYATKSWKEMITSGISLDKKMQRKSLQWIREQSLDPRCIVSLATHDTEVVPHTIDL